MRNALAWTPLLLAFVATNASAGPTEDDSDVTDVQKARTAFSPYSVKMKAALAGDARVKETAKKAQAIAKIKDKAERRKQLAALAPLLTAIRADAIKKAGIDSNEAELKLNNLRSARLPAGLRALGAPGAVISTVKVTSFPTPFGDKMGCADEDDRFDFGADKKTIHVYAQSSVADKDCDRIRAGRTATVQIPSGTRTVSVEFDAKVDIDVLAIAFGFSSEAHASVGLRVNVPGATFSVLKMAPLPDVPLSVTTIPWKTISARSAVLKLWSLDDYENDMQEGEAGISKSFVLPPGAGTTMELTPILMGGVDADLQGFSNLDLDLTLRALKVTFTR